MSVTTTPPAYVGVSVTLSDTNAHNLLTLMTAIVTSLGGVLQNCATLAIQADNSNGANIVYIGDSSVSTTRYAYQLLVHDQYRYSGNPAQSVPLSAIWVLASAATCQLNVEVTFI